MRSSLRPGPKWLELHVNINTQKLYRRRGNHQYPTKVVSLAIVLATIHQSSGKSKPVSSLLGGSRRKREGQRALALEARESSAEDKEVAGPSGGGAVCDLVCAPGCVCP